MALHTRLVYLEFTRQSSGEKPTYPFTILDANAGLLDESCDSRSFQEWVPRLSTKGRAKALTAKIAKKGREGRKEKQIKRLA
jgi:hypothetical protein